MKYGESGHPKHFGNSCWFQWMMSVKREKTKIENVSFRMWKVKKNKTIQPNAFPSGQNECAFYLFICQ